MQLFEQDRNNSQPILGDVVDQFFTPVQFDALTQLASEYQRLKARIVEVHGIVSEEKVSGVMGYFFSGNSSDQYGHSAMLRHTSSFNEQPFQGLLPFEALMRRSVETWARAVAASTQALGLSTLGPRLLVATWLGLICRANANRCCASVLAESSAQAGQCSTGSATSIPS